jgi:hypothetical protein
MGVLAVIDAVRAGTISPKALRWGLVGQLLVCLTMSTYWSSFERGVR